MFIQVEVSLNIDFKSLFRAYKRCIEMNEEKNQYFVESYVVKGFVKFRICQFSQI